MPANRLIGFISTFNVLLFSPIGLYKTPGWIQWPIQFIAFLKPWDADCVIEAVIYFFRNTQSDKKKLLWMTVQTRAEKVYQKWLSLCIVMLNIVITIFFTQSSGSDLANIQYIQYFKSFFCYINIHLTLTSYIFFSCLISYYLISYWYFPNLEPHFARPSWSSKGHNIIQKIQKETLHQDQLLAYETNIPCAMFWATLLNINEYAQNTSYRIMQINLKITLRWGDLILFR